MSDIQVWKLMVDPPVGPAALYRESRNIPAEFQPVEAQWQSKRISVWFLCNPSSPLMPVELLVIGTGHPIPKGDWAYVGTVQQGTSVWHVLLRRLA